MASVPDPPLRLSARTLAKNQDAVDAGVDEIQIGTRAACTAGHPRVSACPRERPPRTYALAARLARANSTGSRSLGGATSRPLRSASGAGANRP